jgi:hypothetical protein
MFMTGYKNLFKMNILSKTLEKASYLVMNRQAWTNENNALVRWDGSVVMLNTSVSYYAAFNKKTLCICHLYLGHTVSHYGLSQKG